MSNMLDNLGEKSVASLREILEELHSEDVRDQAERLRLEQAITRLNNRQATRNHQIALVNDELRTRNPIL